MLQLIPVCHVLVLLALVRVHNETLDRGKTFKCLVKHIFNLLHVRVERKIVRDDLICIHIQNSREITFAPGEIKLRYICCPLFQRLLCAEISVNDFASNLANFALVG